MLKKILIFREKKMFLVVFIILIAVLSFRVGRADVAGDSATYLYRSWGFVDYMSSKLQTTPLQWFSEVKWWQHLSFHDAPPVAFIGMWFFLNLGDASVTLTRFGSALLGAVGFFILWFSVFEKIGAKKSWWWLLTLISITPLVSIVRTNLLESWMVTWLVLGFACFFKTDEEEKMWRWCGLFFGLACATKYTAALVLLGPAVWIALHPTLLKKRELWWGAGIFCIVLASVILYNIMMFVAVGHPDLQISTALGLDTAMHWRQLNHGSDGLWSTLIALFHTAFPLTAVLLSACTLFIFYKAWRTRACVPITLAGACVGAAVQLYLTGGEYRFFIPLFVVMVWCAAYAFVAFYKNPQKKIVQQGMFSLWILCAFGGALATGVTNYATKHVAGPLMVSALREPNTGWGELDVMLRNYLNPKTPRAITNIWGLYTETKGLRQEFQRVQKTTGTEPFTGVIVYDSRVPWFQRLWYFERWNLYRQFTLVSSVEYYDFTTKTQRFFVDQGFDPNVTSFIYAANTTGAVPEVDIKYVNPISDALKNFFEKSGAPQKKIFDSEGRLHFIIFGPLAQ